MSIEINWDRLTEEGGDQLSESIRRFLDQRFKEMTLPSYLKSISVTSFDLGEIAPDIVIQRISDPFPEFYADDDDDDDSSIVPVPGSSNDVANIATPPPAYDPATGHAVYPSQNQPSNNDTNGSDHDGIGSPQQINMGLYSPTNLQYFPSPLQPNILPGLRSPLYSTVNMQSILSASLSRTNSPISAASPSASQDPAASSNRPVSMSPSLSSSIHSETNSNSSGSNGINRSSSNMTNNGSNSNVNHSPNPNASEKDLQLYLHIMYKGDIKVGIETTLLLNYPSPKFVSLPLKLNMSGLEINSIAALAYIDRRIHFSFICDADANGDPATLSGKDRVEIIKDIKIESEIGDREGNGPVLRNVGKIERFLLERLRHLARDELAWPGWITIEI